MSVRLIRLLLRLTGYLPLPAAHALGAAAGELLAWLPTRSRRVARLNLELCFPERSQTEHRRLLRSSFRELGKTVAELGAIWFWPPARLNTAVERGEGLELVETAIARGQGLLVAVPHLGAWELMAPYWGQRLPLHTLYRPPKAAAAEAPLTLARERAGGRVHPATAGGIRELVRALRRGEVVAILPDQKPRGRGVEAPFFGTPASTMTLLPRLAQKSEATVLMGYAERLPGGRGYRMHFLPAPEGVRDPDPDRAAAAINTGVEVCVRRNPEQYQWTYRRFPKRLYRGR